MRGAAALALWPRTPEEAPAPALLEKGASFGSPAPTSAAALALLEAHMMDAALAVLRADPAAPVNARHHLAASRPGAAAQVLRETIAAARATAAREWEGAAP